MKIAVAGKGGVGKTTLASLLAHHYVSQGRPVLCIDADPSPCLGSALGFPDEKLDGLSPIAEMRELIAERTGSDPKQSAGGFFKLNPKVSDLPDKFSASHEGMRLLMLGAVEHGGSGCICPASALLKQLVNHIMVRRDEMVILDLYAGVEHLGRGTAESVDAMLVVAEPTRRSMGTARQVHGLASDIGVGEIHLVGNKADGAGDEAFFADNANGLPLIGCLHSSPEATIADRTGERLYDLDSALAAKTLRLAASLESKL